QGLRNVVPVVGTSHRPGVLRRDGRHISQEVIVHSNIGAFDDAPPRAVPVLDQGPGRTTAHRVVITDSPHVILRDGYYAIESVLRQTTIGALDDTPFIFQGGGRGHLRCHECES